MRDGGGEAEKRPADARPADQRALVAVDLGAESCRVSLLRWPGESPQITLVHRFANAPQAEGETLRWDLAGIVSGVETGLRRAAELATEGIRAVAVDGWAVDYVRLGEDGEALANPFCYRDLRTVAAEERLHERITPGRLGELTAVQPMRINTLYQLHADRLAGLPGGTGWLNLPEYILYRLGGRRVSECTNAGHTQLVDADAGAWSAEVFGAAGLTLEHAPELVPAGSDLGQMTGPLAELPAFEATRLIAPACHDTASAIAGIPAAGDDWAYVSSGTWSLVGALVRKPIRSVKAAADGFTNFAAAGGNTCFHVNVNGMWMIKQCMVGWSERGRDWTIEELAAAAELVSGEADQVLLDVDDPELLLPGAMLERINAQLRRGGHAELDLSPEGAPRVARLIFQSLAARYKRVFDAVRVHTGKSLRRVFVVGGGSRNGLLNRMIAEATGLEVHCGSAESSTIGNFAMQLAVLEGGENPGAERVARWASRLASLPILPAD